MSDKKTIKDIHDGIINYIYDNLIYESNEIIDSTVEKIENSKSMEGIFRLPIDNRIFNFEESIKWLFFIFTTIHYMEIESIIIPNFFDMSFSNDNALGYIYSIYSYKKDDLHKYFEADSDSGYSE
jgi:hypothetical protein